MYSGEGHREQIEIETGELQRASQRLISTGKEIVSENEDAISDGKIKKKRKEKTGIMTIQLGVPSTFSHERWYKF